MAAFLEPERYRNAVIPVYDEVLTCGQVVDIFTQVTGIKARREPNLVLTPSLTLIATSP